MDNNSSMQNSNPQVNNQMILFLKDELKTFIAFQIFIAAICIIIPIILRVCDKDTFYPVKLSFEGFNKAKNGEATITTYNINKIYKDPSEDSFLISACPIKDSPEIKILNAQIIHKDPLGFRKSISHYALSSNSYLFGLLYTMAAMMFIYNAVVYWKIRKVVLVSKLNQLVSKGEPIYNLLIGISLLFVVIYPLNKHTTIHVIFAVAFFTGNLFMMVRFPNKYEKKFTFFTRMIIALVFVATMIFLRLQHILSILDMEWITLFFIAIHLILKAVEAGNIDSKN